MSGEPPDHHWIPPGLIHNGLDIALVLLLTYLMLLAIGERRTLWMVRGLIMLMLAAVISEKLQLTLLKFVLEKLVLGAAVAMAVIFQGEFRRFLELLGQGKIMQLFKRGGRGVTTVKPENVVDELVEAIRELSQNRTGALIVIETSASIDTRVFVNPGVTVNGEISKELLQTIFQPKTLLHDGAVFMRGSRIVSAGVILPLSDKTASRQLGTRHRAAMGITERVDHCICVVVSEETGSISLAERGILDRPLTSSKLKELLDQRFSSLVERESVAPGWGLLSRTFGSQGRRFWESIFRVSSSNSPKEKK
ncbi:diadenylate cyclase CdaA [Crocosphaera sp. XPORK-15E]|uniref:diadenylate cyclase CdaA n=1 Tax=Crocosphaera sp. XPORK-15E TaxID=3110247 RepID=UPI002B1F27A4|nr:diadenylate cyclase CdaA [Crocosphaera sp. XPORK-15E]MEA5535799.1 diadenylate cyclase CdaA [Crocosphaera sp. XPORK-15E]